METEGTIQVDIDPRNENMSRIEARIGRFKWSVCDVIMVTITVEQLLTITVLFANSVIKCNFMH